MPDQKLEVAFPRQCDLCKGQIESVEDYDWHGYGNCVEITDEMWADWEREAEGGKDAG